MKIELVDKISVYNAISYNELLELKEYPTEKIDNLNDININKNGKIYIGFYMSDELYKQDLYCILIDEFNYQLPIENDNIEFYHEYLANDVLKKYVIISIDLKDIDNNIKKINMFLNGGASNITIYHNKQYYEQNTSHNNFSLPTIYKIKNKWFIDNKIVNNLNIKHTVSNYMKDGFLI